MYRIQAGRKATTAGPNADPVALSQRALAAVFPRGRRVRLAKLTEVYGGHADAVRFRATAQLRITS